ncbi:MAG: hypothetical protein Q8Q30_03490 [Candidatus Woesebacteria bacterium]|nr:hypothetical protein [Candidatus Woesebacteria bacterium]
MPFSNERGGGIYGPYEDTQIFYEFDGKIWQVINEDNGFTLTSGDGRESKYYPAGGHGIKIGNNLIKPLAKNQTPLRPPPDGFFMD